MKLNYVLGITILLLVSACQKEASNIAQNNSPQVHVADGNASTAEVWVLPKGFPENSFYKTHSTSQAASLGDPSLYCGGITEVQLYSGNTILGGKVQYANDATNLYVTYIANPDWYFLETNLYCGKFSKMPHTIDGSPCQGRFPKQRCFTYNTLSQSITDTIPLTSLTLNSDGTFTIAAHAMIVRTQKRGNKYSCRVNWYWDDDDDDNSNADNLEIVGKYSCWGSGKAFFQNMTDVAKQTYITGTLSYCGSGPADVKTTSKNH